MDYDLYQRNKQIFSLKKRNIELLFCIAFFYVLIGNSQNVKIVQEVEFLGNKKTKKTVLIKKVKTKKNVVLDTLQLNEDIQQLIRLPSIANATYTVTENETDFVTVKFNIQENFTLIPTFSVYTTNDSEIAYGINVTEVNLLGRNMMLSGFYLRDVFDSYGANFRAPSLFSEKFGIAVSYNNYNYKEPVFFDTGTVNYKYGNEAYEILGLYQLNLKHRFELGVNSFQEKYTYINRGGDVVPPTHVLDVTEDKLLFKFLYDYNNIKYHYHYVSGFRFIYNFQYVVNRTSSETPGFYINWADFLYYKRFGEKGNWASRVRAGLSTNNDSPFAPFSLDNNVNIRGVGNVVDRGTGSIVANTEYRYDLFSYKSLVVQSNMFVDAGVWRKPGGELSQLVDLTEAQVFSGLGLRFIHEKIYNAVFRIDYGFSLNDSTRGFVIGVGQYF